MRKPSAYALPSTRKQKATRSFLPETNHECPSPQLIATDSNFSKNPESIQHAASFFSTHGRTSATCGNLCRLEETASLKEPVGTIEKAGIKRHSCQCLQMMSQSVTGIWPNCHVAFASVTSITSFLCHVTKFHSNHALDRKPMAEESKLNGQSDQYVLEHVFGYTSRITHYSAGKPRREGAKR